MRRLLQWAAQLWADLGPWPEVKPMPEATTDEAPPTVEHLDMNGCDRCHHAAVYHYQRGDQDFRLCGHHAHEHVDAIVAQGWFTYLLNRS